ncbi:MAG: endonuclease [Flavobacterium sp.]|nr:endonuclease [Flavobacterium sp.]
MKNLYLYIIIIFIASGYSQVVINEVDPDTPSTDNMEFIELKSVGPYYALDGFVLVFFNGTSTGNGNTSYYAVDLDGYSTDGNGNILLGNPLVSPTPAIIIPNTTIQNGPDAVAIYLGNATDFPFNTVATNINLIDALAYSNSNAIQATALMSTFGLTASINETLNLAPATQSIQRKNDGTYEVKTPTPGLNNDGSGIVFNYLSFTTNSNIITEGQNLLINFTTSQPVTGTPLVINFGLNNYGFNAGDFSGSLSATIPVGSSAVTATITILNDGNNEGDEELKIVVGTIPSQYSLNNNNKIIRINDANFTILPFGTPLNPTYGNVTNLKPAGYYDSLNGLSGANLKQALQDIIANPTVVHGQNYGDVYDVLKEADQNPANTNQVWLIYTEEPRSKIDYQTGNSIIGKWNREHIYCQSRGGFAGATSSTADGINVWEPAGPTIIATGHGDAHHIRAVDGSENSSRNNRNYGVDYNISSNGQVAWHGDVARACFYMAVRYNGLNVINGNPPETPDGYIGDLATLLTWNSQDPADDFEMNRNNIIYNWQKNRNPFIDMPNLVNYIFGANYGQPWNFNLSVGKTEDVLQARMYPNPAIDFIKIDGLTANAEIEIFNAIGDKVVSEKYTIGHKLNLNLTSGIYLVKISSEEKSVVKKLIIK